MTDNSSQGLWYAQEYLEAKYNNGEFEQMIEHLLECLNDNQVQVQQLIIEKSAKTDDAKLEIIKEYLRNRKSIHLPSELASQIKEISKEMWIRGENGEKDRPKVQDEWAQQHAPSWRQARTIEMQFVVDKQKEAILKSFK
ncbi:MAG: hypothetical protein OCC49_08535 [Fibrobacterales bacterium]